MRVRVKVGGLVRVRVRVKVRVSSRARVWARARVRAGARLSERAAARRLGVEARDDLCGGVLGAQPPQQLGGAAIRRKRSTLLGLWCHGTRWCGTPEAGTHQVQWLGYIGGRYAHAVRTARPALYGYASTHCFASRSLSARLSRAARSSGSAFSEARRAAADTCSKCRRCHSVLGSGSKGCTVDREPSMSAGTRAPSGRRSSFEGAA